MEFKHSPIPVSKWLPHLVPFFITAFVHTAHFHPFNVSIADSLWLPSFFSPRMITAFFKCCPIVCLIVFVVLQEEPLASASSAKGTMKYKALIALGLIFGCIGDACLVYREYFALGMATFAVGHCCYISAFGFKPLKPFIGVLLFALSSILIFSIQNGVPDVFIRRAIPFYSIFLMTMCWRALARVNDCSVWRLVGALGAIIFVISDMFIVLLFQVDMVYGELIVISTYYVSQVFIALSVLDLASNTKED